MRHAKLTRRDTGQRPPDGGRCALMELVTYTYVATAVAMAIAVCIVMH
jgi:hypothetical protein